MQAQQFQSQAPIKVYQGISPVVIASSAQIRTRLPDIRIPSLPVPNTVKK